MKNIFFKLSALIVLLFLAFGYTSNKTEAIKKIDYYADANNKDQLLNIVKKELANKRKPVLFFTATWCGPCKQFKNSLGDPLMIDALSGVTLIMIDGDVDAEKEKICQKYGIKSYPSYLRVDESGKLLKKTDGGAWDENIPKNMAPVLKKFMND